MRKSIAILIALILAIATSAVGQRTTASIRGTITDSEGGLIPGATVVVRNVDTGFEQTTLSNAVGNYSFGDVPIGAYQIRVDLDGFRSAEVTDIQLSVADIREVNVTMEVGDFADVLTVSSPAAPIETIGGEVAGLITGEQIRELPLNGRNFVQLTQLMPGVSSPEGFDTKNKGLLAGVDMSISGGGTTGNLWTVDGASNNDTGSNRTIMIYPSVESIEEFKIHRNSYGAEFGGASGAQVNLVTRSGSNLLKGNVFYFRRDDSWNEKNEFLEQANLDKEPLSRNDYGFTLGGPLLKDKLHFFVSSEWNDEKRGVVRSGFVPTAAERAGDFSGSSIPGCSNAIPTDPLTGQPFPGNQIPGDRIDAGGQGILNLYPMPNVTPTEGSCNNWIAAVTTPIEWQQYNARLDYSPTVKTRLMLRYTKDEWENGAPNAGEANGLWGDDPFPVVDSSWDQPGESLVAQLNQTIGNNAVNTVTFSYSGNEISIDRGGTNPALNNQINANIPSVFPDDDKTGDDQRSHPVFWGGAGYQPLWNIAPWENELDVLVLKDDYEQVFGDHWLKAGIKYGQSTKKENIGGASAFESPQFWGSAGVNGWGATSGNILADFLLEDMTFGFSENSSQPSPELEWEDLEIYLADSWQATSRLSLDYGLRWSRFQWPRAKDNKLASFSPDAYDSSLGGDPCNGLLTVPGSDPCAEAGFAGGSPGPSRGLVDEDEDNFAPRLGLAWDVFGTGDSVLRAGFGQFYQRDRVNIQLEFAGNPPFISSQAGIRRLADANEPCGGCFAFSAGVPRVGIDRNFETPYTLQFNLTWEQRIGDGTLEVSYVGNRGRHLTRRSDINQVPSGDNNGNGINDRLEYVTNVGDTGVLGSLRPYSAFGDAGILYWESNGKSEYDALQTQYIQRFGRGSQFQVSYTYSDFKSDDPLNDAGAGTFSGQITDRDNPGLDWGYAALHRDHIANASLILNLPTLENAGGLTRNLLGDWQMATILYYSSGQALTVTTGGIPGINGASGTGFLDNQRPNRVPGVSCNGSGLQVINPNAYTLNGLQLGTIGNARRGECEGPDYFQIDLSFYKNIRISDRVKAQLRFEVFNVTNEDNFINTVTAMNPTSATFDAEGNAATTITSSTLPLNFGQATAARDPRQVQLGFKLSF